MWSIDPSTGELRQDYREHSDAEVESRLDAARRAQKAWDTTPPEARARTLRRLAAALEATTDEVAATVSGETGLPTRHAKGEIARCVDLIRFFSTQASALHSEAIPDTSPPAYLSRRPFGLVLAIAPWTFPIFEMLRVTVPALLGGNAVMLKPAPNVPATALTLEELLHDAGVPPGLFNVLLLDTTRTAALVEDPRVSLVWCTGSRATGQAVARRAASALTPTLLQLSASNPFLVLEDADLDLAAASAAESRLLFGGQSCLAAKRVIVVEAVRREFESRVVEQMAKAVMGDPGDPATDVGPLARGDLRDRLDDQVRASVLDGAKRLLGGYPAEGPGFFYPPTVLTRVEPGMPVFEEELFGPVLPICSASDEDSAIALANRGRFGLAGAVFTRDIERGRAIAELELAVGATFINTPPAADPRVPLGGIKDSGWGASLGVLGLLNFTVPKAVTLPSLPQRAPLPPDSPSGR